MFGSFYNYLYKKKYKQILSGNSLSRDDINFLDYLSKNNLISEDEYENALFKLGSPEQIYKYVLVFRDSAIRMKDAILNSGNSNYICKYYFLHHDLDLEEFFDALVKLGDSDDVIMFMSDLLENEPNKSNMDLMINILLSNKDVLLMIMVAAKFSENTELKNIMAHRVIECGDDDDIIRFLKIVDNPPIDLLTSAIVRSGNPNKIIDFCYCLGSKGYLNEFILNKIADAIIIKGDLEDIFTFAYRNKDKLKPYQKERLSNIIVNSNDGLYMYKFAMYIDGINIDRISKAIYKTDNPFYIYRYANEVENAPINALASRVVMLNNPKMIYLFALNVKNAPLNILANGIIDTGDLLYMAKFAENIDGINKDKIDLAIRKIIIENQKQLTKKLN